MPRLLSVENFLSTAYQAPSGTTVKGAVSTIHITTTAPKSDDPKLTAIFLQPNHLTTEHLPNLTQQYPNIDWALVKVLAKLEDFTASSGSLVVPDKDEGQVILLGLGKKPTIAALRTAARSITKRAISSKKRHVILHWPQNIEVIDTTGVQWGFGKGVRGTEKCHISSKSVSQNELIDVIVRGLIYNNWSHDLYLHKPAFVVTDFTLVVDTNNNNENDNGSNNVDEDGTKNNTSPLPIDIVSAALHGAESVSFTRELGSLRFQVANNTYMQQVCVDLAAANPDVLKCTVFDKSRLVAEDYNLIASVNQGSWDQCYIVAMEYHPPTLKRRGDVLVGDDGQTNPPSPIAFVAKGITFDTGGLDIKGPTSMFNMHGDKNATCNQLGLFRYLALAQPSLPHPIVGIYCITDNAIGSKAVHPHTIVSTASALDDDLDKPTTATTTTTNPNPLSSLQRPQDQQNSLQCGKISVANNNTDAEGRLVLADGVTLAQKYYHPYRIITWATLTGAVKSALGTSMAGLFTNADYLVDGFTSIGEKNGERFWNLPMIPDNFDDLIGPDCDLKNMAGKNRYMGSSVAAAFINSFVGEGVEFVHLDIAGVASIAKTGGNEAAGIPCTTIQHYVTALGQVE